jgi:hypothetical protein
MNRHIEARRGYNCMMVPLKGRTVTNIFLLCEIATDQRSLLIMSHGTMNAPYLTCSESKIE